MAMVQHHPALNRPAAPACSVCIANYNGRELLQACIESVLAQTGGLSVEIIVHDDASSDDSAAYLREHYPQIELLQSEENVGFCVSNNRMVALARGEHVLLLNNDAALFPDALQSLLACSESNSEAAIISLPQYDWTSGTLVDRGCLLDPFYNPVPNLVRQSHEVAMVIGACLFIRRTTWLDLGGLPEWMGSLAEDMYLCCMARLRGMGVRVVAESGYRHWQGATFGGNRASATGLNTTYRRRRFSECNKLAVSLICTPTPLVWPLLATHLLLLALEGVALTLWRRDRRIWQEIYGPALLHLPRQFGALRTRRQQVQSARTIGLRAYLRSFRLIPQKLRLLRQHGAPRIR